MRVAMLGSNYLYREAPLGSDYRYINAPKMSGWVSDAADTLRDILSPSAPVSEPPAAPAGFFEQYKTPIYIGGAVVGGILLLSVLRKKGRRR